MMLRGMSVNLEQSLALEMKLKFKFKGSNLLL